MSILSTIQRNRLLYLHSYEWCSDDESTSRKNVIAVFNSINSAIELWYATIIIQWDLTCDYGIPLIIKHPCIDGGICRRLLIMMGKLHFNSMADNRDVKYADIYIKGIIERLNESNLPFLIKFTLLRSDESVAGKIFDKYKYILCGNDGVDLPYNYNDVFG